MPLMWWNRTLHKRNRKM